MYDIISLYTALPGGSKSTMFVREGGNQVPKKTSKTPDQSMPENKSITECTARQNSQSYCSETVKTVISACHS
jgi:hypothetical protein